MARAKSDEELYLKCLRAGKEVRSMMYPHWRRFPIARTTRGVIEMKLDRSRRDFWIEGKGQDGVEYGHEPLHR